MIIDETKITTYNSICAVLLREIRVQRGFHRAQFADFFGKPASAWEAIEAGKSRLDLDVLLRVCRGLMQPPGLVLTVADAYERFLRYFGWSVVLTDTGADGLMKLANEYWKSPGGRFADNAPMFSSSILVEPYQQNNVWYNFAPVFRYVDDPQFRTEQNDEERFKPLPSAADRVMQNGVSGRTNGVNGDPEGI
ncbi:hypothetical protein BBJ41_00900 [Burkholderia stabilis]|uniref:helix-turn-helix domain-containing protein n=1 Tax=Burkholderiaceae TaxID=119060 RepID=UPI000851EAE0|nr:MULTISPECIES: helix-turn-helix transcriptional regulator [Burkholderiaceae]AOR66224.1 hypothetical protein BBJ41_00900 [Burkholderia stabilis]PQV53357.1 hypothetical protein B0G83_102443 [Paraburkholderia sp. BL21I4N1]HDR9491970.1 helix-turn-helix transcriptional regulator [Burkholderia stabilis]HDR9523996.1 helix-turn-helix transcriptional regulator [Burkholderia stabilis]HDR9530697.1 helix-turn-helix transcriptional regulator [Burkholderia stabilis]